MTRDKSLIDISARSPSRTKSALPIGDEHVCPQPGGFSRPLPLKSDNCANHDSTEQADDDALKLNPIWNSAG